MVGFRCVCGELDKRCWEIKKKGLKVANPTCLLNDPQLILTTIVNIASYMHGERDARQ